MLHHGRLPFRLLGSCSSILAGDCCDVMAIRSLAISKVSTVEGQCSSSALLSFTGESIGTGLNGVLCRTEVDGDNPGGEGARCPIVGRTRLSPFPAAFIIGEYPLSVFFFLLLGTGECNWCQVFGAREC